MAGLLENIMQGYISKVSGGGRGGNDALAAQNSASAYQRLQEAISQDYAQQKSNAEAQGQQWTMPGPTERMQDQVQAMILSGDQNLQARGLQMLDVPKDDEQSNLEKTAKLLGWTPQQVFDKLHPGAAQTNVSVNLPKMDQPMSLEDLQKLQMPNGLPVPIGTSMREAGQLGAQIGQTKEQAEKGSAAEVSADAIKTLGNNLNPTRSAKDTAIETLRNSPGIIGQVASVAATAAGIPTNPTAVKFNQSVTQAAAQTLKILSGASATDSEFDRIKGLYPQMTDSPATKAIKYNTMLDQTQAIVDRAKSQGVTGLPDMSSIPRVPIPKEAPRRAPGTPNIPSAPKAPQAQQPQTRTTKSGLTYTVEH